MAAISPAVAHHRAKYAALARAVKNGDRPSDDPEYMEAGSTLRALVLAEHVEKVVSAWPPLTRAQKDRVAAILRNDREAIIEARIAELDGGGGHAA